MKKLTPFLLRQWREWRATLLFVGLVIVPLKSSFADWNWVPTSSMNPTILEGDLVFVNKLAYDLRFPLTLQRLAHWDDPQNGDIVVLFSPDDGTRLVKRIIGTPGDTIELRQNRLFLNGTPLDYSPLEPEIIAQLPEELIKTSTFARESLGQAEHAVMATPRYDQGRQTFPPVKIPEGQYFVMGDNRSVSLDSRSFGFADRSLIIGQATHIILSFNILDHYQPRPQRFLTPLN